MGMKKRIAVLTAQIEEYVQTEFLHGFIKSAFEHKFDVSVFAMLQKMQSTLSREYGDSSIYDLINFDLFDAVVIIPDTILSAGILRDLINKIKSEYDGPVFSIDREIDGFNSIVINSSEHVEKIVSHLVEVHKVKDIAYISGKSEYFHSAERLEDFRNIMKSYGLEVDEDRIYYGDFWYMSGEGIAERISKSPGGLPEAIICANDKMAIGAAKYFAEQGIAIPDQIKIVGFDFGDDALLSPVPLTSVGVPIIDCGSYCAETICGKIQEMSSSDINLIPSLFLGRSCGCDCNCLNPESLLRKSWDTNESLGRVNCVYNHLNEDMMLQNSFSGIINSIFLNVFQIRPFAGLNICLNSNWNEESSGYTDKLVNIIKCGDDKVIDSVDARRYYDKSQILPSIHEVSHEPRAFFFYPLHFEANCFGFVSIESREWNYVPGMDERIWIRNVVLGLEAYRRKDSIILNNKIIEEGLNTDPVTGLYNYNGFMHEVTSIISKMTAFGNEIGVVAFDIKNLSGINKVSGHSTGDYIINMLGSLVSRVFDDLASMCFCMGNGEIVALRMFQHDPENGIRERRDKLNALVDEYNQTASDEHKIDIYSEYSFGVVRSQVDLEKIVNFTINEKNVKKSKVVVNGKNLSEEEQKEEAAVKNVLDNNYLNYHFQPIVDARTGEIFSYEALMRSSVAPYPNPLTILKYAGYMDRLYDVEALTFGNVIDIMLDRRDIFDGSRKLFVNSIPGHRLTGDDLLKFRDAASSVKETLVVEITEQSELSDEDIASMKTDFDSLGVQTAVDDFGTGYSNVGNLLRYSPNYLKIDRFLLSEIQDSNQKQSFVSKIIKFSHENGIVVLAEGVETYEELKTVITLGVDLIQGYYTARPQEELVTAIDPKIKNEILQINSSILDDSSKFVYIAGRESRINLNHLSAEETSIIDISENDSSFKDFEIEGIPGVSYNIGIHIHGGYQGHIKLTNTVLRRIVGYQAVIVIEDGCDVTLSFLGDCSLYGSIYVSEDSSVTFEGDGNLIVYAENKNCYGIGSGEDSKCGRMVFDRIGLTTVNCSGVKAVGIGSWDDCSLKFVNGRYAFNFHVQESLVLGSVEGLSHIDITDCKFDVNSNASKCVGFGSIYGDTEISLTHIFVRSDMDGYYLCGIGSLEGHSSKFFVTKSSISFDLKGRQTIGIGLLNGGDSEIVINNASVDFTLKGDDASAFGTLDQNGALQALNSRVRASVDNDVDSFLGFAAEKTTVNACDIGFEHNGQIFSVGDIMRMLHKGPPPQGHP